MAHGPGLTYLFLYGTFLFRFGNGRHPVLFFSFYPSATQLLSTFLPTPASTVEIL